MTNKEPKREWDFFVMWSNKKEWYIIPTFVFFYNKETFLETGVYTPSWGLTIRWLTYMVGIQIQETYEHRDIPKND